MKFSHQHYLLGTYKILAGSPITVFYRWQIWSFKRLTAWDKPSGPHIQAQLRFPSCNARFSNVLGFNFSAFDCRLGTTSLWGGDCTEHWRNFSGIFSPLTRCWWYPIFNSGQQKHLKVLSNTSWERVGMRNAAIVSSWESIRSLHLYATMCLMFQIAFMPFFPPLSSNNNGNLESECVHYLGLP